MLAEIDEKIRGALRVRAIEHEWRRTAGAADALEYVLAALLDDVTDDECTPPAGMILAAGAVIDLAGRAVEDSPHHLARGDDATEMRGLVLGHLGRERAQHPQGA